MIFQTCRSTICRWTPASQLGQHRAQLPMARRVTFDQRPFDGWFARMPTPFEPEIYRAYTLYVPLIALQNTFRFPC